MSVPYTSTVEKDGTLGNQRLTTGLPVAIIAPAPSGAYSAQTFQSAKDVIAEYVGGAGVEAAVYALQTFGASSVVFVRAEAGNPHSYSTVDETKVAGSSTPVVDDTVVPNDAFLCRVQIVSGGTVGSAGIRFKTSLDDGLTYGATFPLGNATSITFAGTGGVKVNLSPGTLLQGDEFSFSVDPAYPTDSELSVALESLRTTSRPWEFCLIAGMDLGVTEGQTVATWLQGLHEANKHRWVIGSFRAKGSSETDNDYLDAFSLFRDSVTSTSLVLTVDRCLMSSGYLSGRLVRAPSIPIAGLCAAIEEHIDPAALDSRFGGDPGGLPGVSIKDASGNPLFIDATLNGSSLDDLGATVLRTWESIPGTHINNCRLLSDPSSNFQFITSRRVSNLARRVLDQAAVRILSKPLEVDRKTGFVSQKQLASIDSRLNAVLSSALLVSPKATAVKYTSSTNDPILVSPFKLTGRLEILPLAYAKAIESTVEFTPTLAA